MTGLACPRRSLGRLFQPFEQGADITNRYGGLGLGMAISKALVDIHAGVLSAASDGPGHGAAFTVTLPLIQASTMKLPMMTGAIGTDRRNTDGISILLVEDHEDSAEVMAKLCAAKDTWSKNAPPWRRRRSSCATASSICC